jgi:hypothetical protein
VAVCASRRPCIVTAGLELPLSVPHMELPLSVPPAALLRGLYLRGCTAAYASSGQMLPLRDYDQHRMAAVAARPVVAWHLFIQ